MPLYVGDYLADTSRLTTEQHGAYLLIIMDYWRSGPPPDDDEVLAAIAKMQQSQWQNARKTLANFFQLLNGCWHHKRIDEELAIAKRRSEARSHSGKLGVEAKRSKREAIAEANAYANGQANDKQTVKQNATQSHIKDITTEKEENNTKEEKEPAATSGSAQPKPVAIKDLVSDGLSEDLACEWLAHRKRKKAVLTPRAWAGVKSEAVKAGISPAAAVEKCLARGWIGFDSEWISKQGPPQLSLGSRGPDDYSTPL